MTLTIWLTQDGELLPVQEGSRLFRTGIVAQKLADEGINVRWFASRFSHSQKKDLSIKESEIAIQENYNIHLLDGMTYSSNFSIKRILHQNRIAANFHKIATTLPKPDLILASYPSPELCNAAANYALNANVPLYIDIRDPWPDSFKGYYPKYVNWALSPLVSYYRRLLTQCCKQASGILAVNEDFLKFGLNYADRTKSKSDSVFYLGYEGSSESRTFTIPQKFSDRDPLTCVFVGIFGQTYDLDNVIEAAKILDARKNYSIKFKFIGDGDFRAKWESKAENLSNIDFLGWLDASEIKKHMRTSHIGLIPIRGGMVESWLGNKFFEYMSESLALVSTVTGEAKSIIEKHNLGFSFNGKEFANELVNTLDLYLEKTSLLNQHMKNSGLTFENNFSASAVYQGYIQHLINAAKASEKHQLNLVQNI
ncbi:MAG: glycosyltransferase [Bdellovibrionota bacterium]